MKDIVIIPWFNYWRTKNSEEFSVLIESLKKEGFHVHLFDYEERPDDLNDLLERLNKFILSIKTLNISLIGFSLGSYISVRYVQKYKNKNIKRILLCVPLVLGSKFFRTCYKLKLLSKYSTGKVIYDASYERLDPLLIPKNIRVGIIQGKKRIKRKLFVPLITQLFFLGKKNDGLISLSETEFGHFEKKILNIGHFESPKNQLVIDNIIQFLINSKFT